jgi:hypothetical protein
MMKILRLLLILVFTFISSLSAANDQAILTITGNIAKTNQPDNKTFIFSFDALRQLPNTIVRTKTIWTPTSDFEGPMMRDVLSAVGANANAKEIQITTFDNYPVTIPIEDFNRWEVVLAHTKNGKRLTMASKGPLWIMYPVDKYKSELDNNITRTKIVWAVKSFVVH